MEPGCHWHVGGVGKLCISPYRSSAHISCARSFQMAGRERVVVKLSTGWLLTTPVGFNKVKVVSSSRPSRFIKNSIFEKHSFEGKRRINLSLIAHMLKAKTGAPKATRFCSY